MAEADHGEAVRFEGGLPELPRMQPNADPTYLLDLANRACRATYLFARAATPADARELLTLRGRPRLGILIGSMGSSPATGAAQLLDVFAANIDRGHPATGWFEREEDPLDVAARTKVAAALRWAAGVYRKYALTQVVRGPTEEMVMAKEARKTKRKSRAKWTA